MWVEELLGVPLTIFFLCLLAGGTRVFLAVGPTTVKGIIGTLLAALFLALILHPFLVSKEYGQGFVTLLVAIGSFAARDILLILPKLLEQIAKDPLALVRDYLNWRESKKPRSGDDE